METNLISFAYADNFDNMKGFVGDIFGHLFIVAAIAAISFMAIYIPFVLWRDR